MGMVTCVYLVMKFMVIHVYICLDLPHILSCFSGYSFISHQLSSFPNISKYDTFQICTLLPTLHDLHQEMKPTNPLVPLVPLVYPLVPLVYPFFFQTNLWGLSLRLNAGLKTRSDF